MDHDPLLSTARKPFSSFGHGWVTLALWVPLPMGQQRGGALPLLFHLYTGSKRGGEAAAPARRWTGHRQQAAQAAHASRPRQTKLELARELFALVAGWAGQLGLEDPQDQTSQAVHRTAPLAFLVYALILLWYAAEVTAHAAPAWVARPWYRRRRCPPASTC